MASTIFFVNHRGEEVVSRHYRGDVTKTSMDAFRSRIIAAKVTELAPVVYLERTSFMFIRHQNMFLVAAARLNSNVAMIFEYLLQMLRILKFYLGSSFSDDDLQGNFTLIYELFDETMDNGYPQLTAIEQLKQFISGGELMAAVENKTTGTQLTSQLTGTIDWRTEGLKFRENKVNIEVIETVSLVMSTTGSVLRAEILGKVMMTTQLTGMPECKFGLNDKLIMEREGGASAHAVQTKATGVDIDDFTFHRCVRLGKFDTDRTITFIPPHGNFELMKYRVVTPAQPFRIVASIAEEGKNKLMVNIKINADFQEDRKATRVVIKIPLPTSTATAKIMVGRGRAKYEPGERAIVWRIGTFPGSTESTLNASVDLIQTMRERKPWSRPPVTIDFQIQMYSCSGVQVRFLKVYDKSNYQTQRRVSYLSKAGEYQLRI